MFKKVLSIFLACVLVLGTMGTVVLAEEADLSIGSIEELIEFAEAVNGGNNYSGKYVKLTCDLDMSEVDDWTPIGMNGKRFQGTFDGDGHTISNFTSIKDMSYGNGFFSDITGGATIKNITFDNAYVSRYDEETPSGNVYGIVSGYAYGNVTFENITVKNSKVVGFGKVGAILGMAADPGTHTTTVRNCKVENTVIKAIYESGGIVGLLMNNIDLSGSSIENVTWEKGDDADDYINVSATLKDNSDYTIEGSFWADYIAEYNALYPAYGTFYTAYYNLLPSAFLADDVEFDGKTYKEVEIDGTCSGDAVAKIGNAEYASLADAVDAAEAGSTITLLDDAVGKGVVINKNITIDFNGKTYSLNEGVGSKGTESNGLQILKDNTVTIKNGTLKVAEGSENKFYILVQNYANLTVEDMTLDGTGLDKYSKSTDPADGDSYTLSVNCGTVEIKGKTNIRENNDGDKAVAVSADKFSTYTEPNVTINTTGLIEGKVTDTLKDTENGGSLTIKGGYFTENPSAYLADGKVAKYDQTADAYSVEDAPSEGAIDVTTDVADCVTNATTPEGSDITNEQLAEITTAIAGNTNTIEKLEKVAANMQYEEDVVGSAAIGETEEIVADMIEQGVTVGDDATVTVVIQPYLDIVVNAVEDNTVKLEIEPMYNVVATTATGDDEIITEDGESKNAVVLKEAQKLEVTAPIEITVGLPNGFADNGETVYIHHTKDNGTTYVYEATVTVADDKTTATFTNPNGFSKFEVKAGEDAAGKAKIGETVYATLADAVANVADGETIVLLADVDEDVTVTEIIKFSIDTNGKDFDADENIVAGDKRKVTYTEADGVYTFTVKKKTTPPTTNNNNSPSWDDNNGFKDDNSYVPSKPQQSVPDKTFKFSDVADDFWGYDGIYYCYENGIMNGMGGSVFEPNTTMTRAMLVTMLYRLEGSPEIMAAETEWYSKAQAWAMENAVSDGTNMTDEITREQLATMLCRYASKQGVDTSISADLTEFTDNADISEYAYSAVSWAVRSGLINGMGDGTISPKSGATRAQVATIFMRAADILK